MVKYVVAGKSDCPFFARIELLADELEQRLPDFSVHKIVVSPEGWGEWVADTCQQRGWKYNGQSPIVWRELINRGGKGILVGSANEFLETVKGYYLVTNDKSTDELQAIADENKKSKVVFDDQESKRTSCSKPYRVTVTGAHSDLAYNLLPHLCANTFCNEYKDLHLTLYSPHLNNDNDQQSLDTIAMELQDCAYPELRKIVLEKDLRSSFSGADLLIILNTSEVNSESMKQLKEYGCALEVVKHTTKVLVAGVQPVIAANIIVLEAAAGGRPLKNTENIYALTGLFEKHLKSFVAKKLSINTPDVSNLFVWGRLVEFIKCVRAYENTQLWIFPALKILAPFSVVLTSESIGP